MKKRDIKIEPKKVKNLTQVKRLLAEYLYLYQKGDSTADEFKTIIYGCIKYAEICKIESQIKNPEGLSNVKIDVNVRSNGSSK